MEMAKRSRGPEGCGSFFCEKDRKGASDGEGNAKKYHRARGGEHVANMEEGGREKRHIQQKEVGRGGRREQGEAAAAPGGGRGKNTSHDAIASGGERKRKYSLLKRMDDEKGNIEMSKGTRGSNGLWESQKQKIKKSPAEETFHGALCVSGWERSGVRKRAQEEQRRIQPAGREVHPALECEFAVDLGEEQLLFVGEQKGAAAGREHVAEVLQEGRV